MNIAPATLTNDIIAQLNNVRSNVYYAEKSSLIWIKIKRQCEKLVQANAAEGWGTLGLLYTTAGDVEEMERSFFNAIRLGGQSFFASNILASYGNLGLFSKAHALFEKVGDPEGGNFSELFQDGIEIGAFHKLSEFIGAAKKMNIEIDNFRLDLTERATSVLARAGISDSDVASNMDAAGTILRRKRIFASVPTDVLVTDVAGEFSGVTITFKLPLSPAEVFEFNIDLAAQEEVMHLKKSPAFDVVFLPA